MTKESLSFFNIVATNQNDAQRINGDFIAWLIEQNGSETRLSLRKIAGILQRKRAFNGDRGRGGLSWRHGYDPISILFGETS
jgi:hypothetical protein